MKLFKFFSSVFFCFLSHTLWAQEEIPLDDLMSPEEIWQELEPEATFEDEDPMSWLTQAISTTASQPRDSKPYLPEESQARFGTPWLKAFEVVLVINKAQKGPTAQRAMAYWRGKKYGTFVVSTGREKQEVAASGKRYFSSTPTGWFSPTRLVRDHFSNTWKSRMPFSVFFNGGIATHAVLPAYVNKLGTRASGGCVRLLSDQARWVYDRIRESGKGLVPAFKRTGEPVFDQQGRQKYMQNWRSLIIVINRDQN